MEVLLKSSAILGMFYLCYKLLLEKETFFQSNRIFLNIGLIAAMVLPWVVIPKYITKTAPLITDSNLINTQALAAVENASFGLDWSQVIIYFYIAGLTFFGIRLLMNFISLRRLMKGGKTVINGKHRLIHINDEVSPFSFFNRIVFNPDAFQSAELEQIIEHEKVHATQGHSLDLLFVQLFCMINWFNPIAWLYKTAIEQNLEFIADSEAKKFIGSTRQYQQMLLNSVAPDYKLVLANNFFNSIIKKRIIMLQKQRSNRSSQLKMMLIAPVLALFLMSFNTKEIITYEGPVEAVEAGLMVSDNENTGELVEVIINKDMTNQELDELVDKFASMDITLKFKGVKRNKSGEITAIQISVKTEKSSANFNANSDEGITPVRIKVDDNSVSIGDGGVHEGHEVYRYRTSDDGNVWIKKVKGGENVHFYGDDEDVEIHADEIIIKSGGDVKTIKKGGKGSAIFIKDGDEEGEVEIIEIKGGEHEGHEMIIRKSKDGKKVKEWIEKDKGNVWVEDDDDDVRVIIKNEGKEKIKIAGDSEDALILLDGKEVKKSEIDALDADKIESVEVIKGKKAIEKYGEKGKNGVIVIKRKN